MRPPYLRLLEPAPGILAWYDGRVPGYRIYAGPNWVDDGAIELGIAAYAVITGDAALVYDTHVSLAHARAMRTDLEARGVTRFTTILSHWHLDHVAGTEVFADGPVLANARTAEHLKDRRAGIEAGTRPPAIAPLILPDETFADRTTRDGAELIRFDIHSDDGTVLWLPERRILLAGDTLEDPITYVAEPEGLERHLAELDRLAALGAARILPNHGDPDVIGAGGYGPGLIDATRRYISFLLGLRRDPSRRDMPLREVIADDLADGTLRWFEAYEGVHRNNLAEVLGNA